MKQVFGTEDRELQSKLLDQASGAAPDFGGRELKSFDYVAAILHGIASKDELEGLLAVQRVKREVPRQPSVRSQLGLFSREAITLKIPRVSLNEFPWA